MSDYLPGDYVRVPAAFHPLNGQLVTATYTKHYTGRLVDEGPDGAALHLVDEDGLTVCYVDGERWTIEAAPMEEPIARGDRNAEAALDGAS
jgi:hypothetical protein